MNLTILPFISGVVMETRHSIDKEVCLCETIEGKRVLYIESWWILSIQMFTTWKPNITCSNLMALDANKVTYTLIIDRVHTSGCNANIMPTLCLHTMGG